MNRLKHYLSLGLLIILLTPNSFAGGPLRELRALDGTLFRVGQRVIISLPPNQIIKSGKIMALKMGPTNNHRLADVLLDDGTFVTADLTEVVPGR